MNSELFEPVPSFLSQRVLNSSEISVDQYQEEASQSDIVAGDPSLAMVVPVLGLLGEVGSIVSAEKRNRRDGRYSGHSDELDEEFGDALWYIAIVTRRCGLRLSDLVEGDVTFEEAIASRELNWSNPHCVESATQQPRSSVALIQLGASVGGVLSIFLDEGFQISSHVARPPLTRLLKSWLHAVDAAERPASRIARMNLVKAQERWPTGSARETQAISDKDHSELETIPKKFAVDIAEVSELGKSQVVQLINGVIIGDRITDNVHQQDEYRFHDVFHLAYAAKLGWSPVMRTILRRKRKSNPRADENEDGARAAIIEEAIAAWVFEEAKKERYFEGRSRIDYDLIRTIKKLTAPFEVSRCPAWMWEEAILVGFEAFRFLRDNRKARIIVDTSSRKLFITPIPKDFLKIEKID